MFGESTTATLVGTYRPAGYKLSFRNKRQTAPDSAVTTSQHDGLALLGALNTAARDLKAPLAKVRVLLELLDAWDYRQALSRLAPRTHRVRSVLTALDSTVQDLLHLATETGDALSFNPSMVDLNDLVDTVVSLARPALRNKTITVLRCADKRISIWADAQLSQQAIDLVFGHMLRQAPREGKLLCELFEARGHAVIRVSDDALVSTGVESRAIFRPFDQLTEGTPKTAKSRDLKLWLVRLIMERHGGSAVAHLDETGAEACLEISFPLGLS